MVICNYPVTYNGEHLFTCFLALCISLVRCLFRYLSRFFKNHELNVRFLVVEFKNSLFWIAVLLQIFSLVLWFVFPFSGQCLFRVDAFNFNQVQLIDYFFFYGLCLGAVFKKVIAILMIIQIFSRYFLGYLQFCIVHLSLWSFRDNFCEGCMICIQTYFFLHVDVQLSQEHLLKELFFLHCTACVPLSNIC